MLHQHRTSIAPTSATASSHASSLARRRAGRYQCQLAPGLCWGRPRRGGGCAQACPGRGETQGGQDTLEHPEDRESPPNHFGLSSDSVPRPFTIDENGPISTRRSRRPFTLGGLFPLSPVSRPPNSCPRPPHLSSRWHLAHSAPMLGFHLHSPSPTHTSTCRLSHSPRFYRFVPALATLPPSATQSVGPRSICRHPLLLICNSPISPHHLANTLRAITPNIFLASPGSSPFLDFSTACDG